LVNNTNAAAEVITGELGLAAFDGESVTLGSLEQNNGLVVGGAVALTTLTKNAGRLLMRQLTAAGVVTIRG
jgi:predicted NUDIX family NTP pyrophosphohydrolase